uniref:Sulfotransferase 1C2 n=4 Tax=Culex pipiens TaxID=7175 RepID=A0A8D8K999_CULPI
MFHYNSLPRAEVARFETPYTENLVEVCLDDLSVNPTGDPTWSPVHCVMPGRYREFADRIRNLTIFEDDVWIVTFPKAGTTWTQEMVWLIDHDLDYEMTSKVILKERSIYLELFTIFTNFEVRDTVTQAEQMPRPRHIKSHLPLALLPKQLWTVRPKIIYTARNPQDVATSLMHHYKYLQGFRGSQQDFFDGVLADRLDCCPMVRHVTEFWRVLEQHGDHVLFLHFEDMKRDLAAVIRKVCEFFGKVVSEEQVEKLKRHLSFESMKGL